MLEAVFCGILAYAYSEICTRDGMIFFRLWQWSEQNLPTYLNKPLIGCAYCVSGQLALWTYLILTSDYNFIYHVFFIGVSMVTTDIIKRI